MNILMLLHLPTASRPLPRCQYSYQDLPEAPYKDKSHDSDEDGSDNGEEVARGDVTSQARSAEFPALGAVSAREGADVWVAYRCKEGNQVGFGEREAEG